MIQLNARPLSQFRGIAAIGLHFLALLASSTCVADPSADTTPFVAAAKTASSAGAALTSVSLDTAAKESNMMLVIMTILYIIQVFFSVIKAAREPVCANQKILRATFGGQGPLITMWISAATVMLFPTLLSWFLGFFHHPLNDKTLANVAAYMGSVALLTTLVTVELTLLQDLRGLGKKWLKMLVISLALDVLSLFIFSGFIGAFVDSDEWSNKDPFAAVLMGTMAGSACISSFLIILFAKVANSFPNPGRNRGVQEQGQAAGQGPAGIAPLGKHASAPTAQGGGT
jgi:hypothetical protein